MISQDSFSSLREFSEKVLSSLSQSCEGQGRDCVLKETLKMKQFTSGKTKENPQIPLKTLLSKAEKPFFFQSDLSEEH